MNKIKTIFDRDWEGNRGVVNKPVVDLSNTVAYEKVDGTNIRITVRNKTCVRVEKRRNPTKLEKAKGIVDPWYIDADRNDPSDKYIFEAVDNTDPFNVIDGEWSAEAYGEKIQGNPLQITGHRLFIFSLEAERKKVQFDTAPKDFVALSEWLPKQKSKINPSCGIEGLVWWNVVEPIGKIKLKDFKG